MENCARREMIGNLLPGAAAAAATGKSIFFSIN